LEALLLKRLGRYDASVAATQRALDIDPHNASARADLAQLCITLGRFDDAINSATELLRQSPTSANGLQYLSYAYLAKGDTAAAIRLLAASRPRFSPADMAWDELPLALWRHDLVSAMAAVRLGGFGFFGAEGNSSGDFDQGAYAAQAMLSKLAGDHDAARSFADSAIALGKAIKAKADRRAGDPFGTGAFADLNSAVALAVIGDPRAVPLGEAAARRFNLKVDGADGASTTRLMALVYELAGRPHDAVAQLRIATSPPIAVTLPDLRHSALWDPLRGDPEFKALLAGR
jgi:tetratricopeptide (TPR) repeat protein